MTTGLEIRRWIGVPKPKYPDWDLEVQPGPTAETVQFGSYARWAVRADYLLAALDELDHFEKRRKLDRERIEVRIPIESEEETHYLRSIPSALHLTPTDEKGQVEIRQLSMSGGTDTVERGWLRYAIEHRNDLRNSGTQS